MPFGQNECVAPAASCQRFIQHFVFVWLVAHLAPAQVPIADARAGRVVGCPTKDQDKLGNSVCMLQARGVFCGLGITHGQPYKRCNLSEV